LTIWGTASFSRRTLFPSVRYNYQYSTVRQGCGGSTLVLPLKFVLRVLV